MVWAKRKMAMTNRNLLIGRVAALSLGFLFLVGCDQPMSTPAAKKTNFVDKSITEHHNLGWLGGKAHPLNDVVRFDDPEDADKSVSPGGIVITEVEGDMPLGAAGLQQGDVVVRVAEDWLPIKEDALPDLFEKIETQISGDKNEIEIGYLRSGEYVTATLATDKESIDEGLPLATPRGVAASTATLKYLSEIQAEDGSFTADSNQDTGRLVATSIAGLAFLAADETVSADFAPHADKCTQFISEQLDNPISELDPLVAAYVAMFLSESNVTISDADWLSKFDDILQLFAATQHESGGWHTTPIEPAEGDSDPEAEAGSGKQEQSESEGKQDEETDNESQIVVDAVGTFATNQILFAIGALERKGVPVENAMVEQGCKFLHEQGKVRIPSSLDRRTKAALAAGTAATMVSLNCDRSNVQLTDYLKTAMARANDMYFAPTYGMPGLVSAAIVSRQLGNESWMQFHNAFKYIGLALQEADGGFASYPNVEREYSEFEQLADGDAWRTGQLAIIQTIQSQRLKKLLALEQPEDLASRDAYGKQIDANATAGQSGVQMMQLDANGVTDPEELKKLIMEKLKDSGIDVDASNMKIQKGSKPKK